MYILPVAGSEQAFVLTWCSSFLFCFYLLQSPYRVFLINIILSWNYYWALYFIWNWYWNFSTFNSHLPPLFHSQQQVSLISLYLVIIVNTVFLFRRNVVRIQPAILGSTTLESSHSPIFWIDFNYLYWYEFFSWWLLSMELSLF